MPAGSVSRSSTLVAAAVPELVYDNVTVMPAPPLVFGEGPLATDSDFVTEMTELATVVVSVLVVAVVFVSETETVMAAVLVLAALTGTVPATTNRKIAPAAMGPEVVIGVALSGMP